MAPGVCDLLSAGRHHYKAREFTQLRVRKIHRAIFCDDSVASALLSRHHCNLTELAGRVVYTGSTRDLGADLDTFEDRLVELLTQEGLKISSKTR